MIRNREGAVNIQPTDIIFLSSLSQSLIEYRRDYENAFKYIGVAINIAQEYRDTTQTADLVRQYSIFLEQKGDIALAIEFLKSSVQEESPNRKILKELERIIETHSVSDDDIDKTRKRLKQLENDMMEEAVMQPVDFPDDKDFDNIDVESIEVYSYDHGNDKWWSRKITAKIASTPFAEGSWRHAYYMLDLAVPSCPLRYKVCKIQKIQDSLHKHQTLSFYLP